MGKNIINIALFGLGRIGQMHAENLLNNKNFNLKYIFDKDQKLTKKLSKKYNSTGIQNPKIAFKDQNIKCIFSNIRTIGRVGAVIVHNIFGNVVGIIIPKS